MGVITKPCAGWCFKIADNGYRFHRISNHNYTTDIKAVRGRLVADIRTETVNNYHQQTKTELTILPENDGMSLLERTHMGSYHLFSY